jgi:hypothetical protein
MPRYPTAFLLAWLGPALLSSAPPGLAPAAAQPLEPAQSRLLGLPITIPLLPALVETIDSLDLLQKLGNSSFRVREDATRDLANALLGQQLTLAQIQDVRHAANGEGLGTDPEIRRRSRDVFSRYVRRVEESLPLFKIQILLDGNTSLSYEFGPYTGLLNRTNAQEVQDFNKLQDLARAAQNALTSGDVPTAQARLTELKTFLLGLTATRYSGLGLYQGGSVPLPQATAASQVQQAIDQLPQSATEIQGAAGSPPTAPAPKIPIQIPTSGPAIPATGSSFRLVIDNVLTPGEVDLTSYSEDETRRLLAVAGYQAVSPVYDIVTDGVVQISGEVQVGIQYSDGLLDTLLSNPGELQIARVANGEVQILPTILNDLLGGVLWASYTVPSPSSSSGSLGLTPLGTASRAIRPGQTLRKGGNSSNIAVTGRTDTDDGPGLDPFGGYVVVRPTP